MLIVPEQFLFESERSMYTALGARKIAEVEITALSKLSAEVIKQYGEPKLYADDIVKAVTMYKTLTRIRSRLTYFANTSFDAAGQMLALVADFKAAAVTPDALRERVIDGKFGDESPLSHKLTDVSEIYTAYSETLAADFADKLDDNRIAAELINRHSCYAGCHVFVHEFDSFSASQIALLAAIAQSADTLEILLRTDSEASDGAARSVNTVISRLKRVLCDDGGLPYEYVDLGGSANTPSVRLWTAGNISDECEAVAAEIRRLITTRGYTCNDIAVLMCDNAVKPRFKEAMAEYDVACYADLPEPISTKPIVRFVIAALKATSLDTPALLSYIRSGFVRVPAWVEGHDRRRKYKRGEVFDGVKVGAFTVTKLTRRLSKRSMDLLERAAFKYALKKREWGKVFPEQMSELAEIEPLRLSVVRPLLQLREECTDTTGDKITEAVCAFLLDVMQLQRSVLQVGEEFQAEFRQLWELVVDVFESLHASLSGVPVSLGEYVDVLCGVCAGVNIAKPPQVLDSVAIGDIERSRWGDVRVTFVMGANLSAFPRNVGAVSGDTFTGNDIEVLAYNGIELTARLEQRYAFERTLMEKALTLPDERLYLTAPLSDAAWRELSPSPVFADLSERHGVPIRSTGDFPPSFRARTAKSAARVLAECGVSEVTADNAPHVLEPMTCEKLFSFDTLKLSPTAVETMMSCRFAYFCQYGLRLDSLAALNEDEPIALERGNIIHHCLDAVLRNGQLFTADEGELERLVEGYIKEYRGLRIPQEYAQTKRQSHILMSFKAGIVRMLSYIRGSFEGSGFRPAEFEKRVDFALGDVRLTGVIDRIDRMGEYVRVVDYKSGAVSLDVPSLYYGLNLQMLLYLFSECSDSGSLPASALYLPADGAKGGGVLLPSQRDKAALKWLKSHRPSGVTIADGSPAHVDFAEWESRIMKRVNARISTVTPLTPTAYGKLREHCTAVINARVQSVRSGAVSAVPVVTNNRNVCDYCGYGMVCGRSDKNVVEVDKTLIEGVISGGN